MFEPVKVGFGEFMTEFYNSIVPTTKALEEYVLRGVGKSIAWAPSRMVDEVESMLASWQRNDTDSAPTQPAKTPVIIVAMAKDYTPTGRDYTHQVSDSVKAIIPGDTKERLFGLRAIAGDIRVQVAFIAMNEPTAKSLAAQFCLFLDRPHNRNFWARFSFAGVETQWPVEIESQDSPVANAQSQSNNVTLMVCDLTLKAEIPLYDAPKVGEPNDGRGVPGTSDPAGYPVVIEVDFFDKELNLQKTVV
jgi:hypothetical protein